MKIIVCLWFFMLGSAAGDGCIARNFGASSVACVCNATYCDFIEPIAEADISGGKFLHYATTKDGLRLSRNSGKFTTTGAANRGTETSFTVVRNTTYQEMFGFGGAITDSAVLNIMKLSEKTSENLLRSYFGKGGSQYLFLRLPMGDSDFSVTYYSYADVENDVQLKHFNLTISDYNNKIPIIKKAAKMRGEALKLFTVPWSAPWWMLINTTKFSLNESYYQTFANYFVKYLDAYGKEGIHMWGLNPQNEPTHGQAVNNWIPGMAYTEQQMTKWVGEFLGPTLAKAGYGHLKMMLLDDNRRHLLGYARRILSNTTVHKYSSGVALHWYEDKPETAGQLTTFHDRYPDQFLFNTESSIITRMTVQQIGSWEHAERYISSLFQAFNNWVSGWADWNLALNEEGGPQIVAKKLRQFGYPAAIHVNSTSDEFYKQPIYYVLAHFSAFVEPNSKRVRLDSSDEDLLSVAFLSPEGRITVVLANTGNTTISTRLSDKSRGSIQIEVRPRSIHTVIYK